MDLQKTVAALLAEEEARLPPMRDIGKLCFDKLEAHRRSRRKIGERGGSIIKGGR